MSKLSALPSSVVLGGAAALLAGGGALVMTAIPDAPPQSPSSVLTANLADSIVDTSSDDPTRTALSRSTSSRTVAISRAAEREAVQLEQQRELTQRAALEAERRSDALDELAQKTKVEAQRIDFGQWVLPLSGYRLTAGFGEFGLWSSAHTGLDFAAPSGTRLLAVSGGTIVSTSYAGAYGYRTILRLTDGTRVWYCHQASFAAHEGQTVSPGELIGYVGSTGNSTGSHLHLEVRPRAGHPVDPYAALVAQGVRP